METLKSIIKSYETWVADNPETVSDVETTTKWISYFIAGRVSDSTIVSELIYSLSNILVLYNDHIIERKNIHAIDPTGNINNNNVCYRLKVMLTTLEYCEVFIEISAKRMFGRKGKWIFVVLLQVVKAFGRFFILKHSMDSIITTPTIPSLNRRTFMKQQNESVKMQSNSTDASAPSTSFTFQLKRSGRVVRKVEGAPPLQYRDKLQQEITACNNVKFSRPAVLLQAEYLYIAKPLLHLASMGIFGEKRWKQYMIALTIDLFSIRLYYKNRHLMNKQQKLEMSRRCINLLLYLMRSPLYERYTQSRLDHVLGSITRNIPLAKILSGPLKDYIPHWQNTYFYLWST